MIDEEIEQARLSGRVANFQPGAMAAIEAPKTPDSSREERVADVETPPSGEVPERLQRARTRRLAWRAALGALRGRGDADIAEVHAAVATGDTERIVLATIRHAIGALLDSELGRPSTAFHEISVSIETELQAAAYADPHATLAGLEGDDGLDVALIREYATAALTPDPHRFHGVTGQLLRPDAPSLSLLRTMQPRR